MTDSVVTDHGEFYEIRTKGQIDPSWSDWFEGLTITYRQTGETVLSGPVKDQSALHGLLAKIRDLNLTLISVAQIPSKQTDGRENENSK